MNQIIIFLVYFVGAYLLFLRIPMNPTEMYFFWCFVIAVPVGIICVTAIIRYQDKKYWNIVKQNSEYIQAVKRLNESTDYHEVIGEDGQIRYSMYVNSKTKFDKATPLDALYEYLLDNRDAVESILYAVNENRKINRVYTAAFNDLHSSVTEEECQSWKIDYDVFRQREEEIVNAIKLDITTAVQFCCAVKYSSLQGRNNYSKECIYLESEIRVAIKELEHRAAYVSSEEYRRKTERSKVSPKLRLAVLKRDNYRCRYCGRSADDGVKLEVDHIIPISKGGNTTYSNLQTLCWECNRGKGSQIM